MNILFIWDGNELSDFMKDCIKRASEVYPDAHLVCISKGDWPFDGYELLDWKPFQKKILDRYGLVLDMPYPFSDYARYIYLSEHPYSLYLDTDVYCTEPIPDTDRIGRYEWDGCALWNGNNTKVFYEVVKPVTAKNHTVWCVPLLPDDSFDLKPYCQHKEIVNLKEKGACDGRKKLYTETV